MERTCRPLLLAATLFDAYGPLHVSADIAWQRTGWWVPADDAAQGTRQARDFMAPGIKV
jgi:hypothetical protein